MGKINKGLNGDGQGNFRFGKGCVDQVFTSKQVKKNEEGHN